MITSSDKDYIETKSIKQNKTNMKSEFVGLAHWINSKFDVSVLNVFYDFINDKNKTPRLSIILEYKEDELKFRDDLHGNFDSEKQRLVAQKFKEIKRNEYDAENVFVIFTSFEPIAKDEANSKIPSFEIEAMKNEIGLNDIWKIHRQFSWTTFLFFTNKQVDENSKNGNREIFSKAYFNLLTKYDEFNYFKENTFSILLDSKENFDNNYSSNWFYYDR
ncbi:hypothetical protein [Flavobacterium sp. UBA7663]|uniref:hypothetical protein n=1 Tax=Flavobacterium sp. UBA7663 TaxID=1946557 RepID=UPI0025BCA4BD|nr:hypothetical protein [Flavobacterium sp. UBA7663]